MDIFDLTGQKVRTLVRDIREPGFYKITWDGTSEQGITVSTGIYLTRLQSGEFDGQAQEMVAIGEAIFAAEPLIDWGARV